MRPLTPRRKVRLIRDAFDTLEQTGPEAGIEDDYYFIDLTDEEDIPNAAARLTQRFPPICWLCGMTISARAVSARRIRRRKWWKRRLWSR